MYEAVIFDFDGVIIDSELIHYKACCSVFSEIGLTLSRAEYFEKYLGLSDKQMFPEILDEKGYSATPDVTEQLISKKIEAYNGFINEVDRLPVIKGLEEYIDYAVQHFNKFAICTGSTKVEVMTALKKMDHQKLTSCLTVIITAEDIQHGKPSPEGYLLTAKQLEVSPNKCLAIEDSPHGIKAAKAAGMYVIALTTTFDEHHLRQADKVVSDFTFLV